MKTIWEKEQESICSRPLVGEIITDVVVIGGGIAGVLTAHFLQQAGKKVVVLEANQVGSGQTRGSSAKITAQHGLIYSMLIQRFGPRKAAQYASGNLWAVEQYEQLINRSKIECDYEKLPSYAYSVIDKGPIEREIATAKALGMEASFTMKTTLPFRTKGAMRLENQGQFNPLDFVEHLAKNLDIYDKTRAIKVKNQVVTTENGVVRGKNIVFATHFPFVNVPGYYLMRQHQERSYVLALEGAQKLDGTYIGVDPDHLSMRNVGDLLLLGGGNHPTGQFHLEDKYAYLQDCAHKLWPESKVVAKWSAQDCMPLDGLPYIGRFSIKQPNWYVLTGFQKWGISTAMLGAHVISNAICHRENPYASLFSPARMTPFASAKELTINSARVANSIFLQKLMPTEKKIDGIPPHSGGIVNHGGQKVGAYRDGAGKVYLVSLKCPHFGCQLEWNSGEKTWDCPCHGSRFDFKGNLLDNPAQIDLEVVK